MGGVLVLGRNLVAGQIDLAMRYEKMREMGDVCRQSQVWS